MQILIDHSSPFLLAHGGMQIQIEQTCAALKEIGVDAQFLRWWDESQGGDLIHYFGRPLFSYIDLAHRKGIKIVFSALHGTLGIRARWKRQLQAAIVRLSKKAPRASMYRLGWESYREADACIALTSWEAHLIREVFCAPAEKLHVVPNGVEELFFQRAAATRGGWLVTTASILPVKRVLETARAAILAKTPYWVIGKPMDETEIYYQEFCKLCREQSSLLRYEGALSDRARLAAAYREARGFVLLSQWESLSISALEAAASGCPLLLSDLQWARSVFGSEANYCPPNTPLKTVAGILREFYEKAPALPSPKKPKSWTDVARQLKGVYELVLKTS